MFGPEGFWDFIRGLRVFFGGGRGGLNTPQGTTLVGSYGLYSAIWGGGGDSGH